MAYDGSIKIDTKVDTSGFSSGIDKLKSIAKTGVTALTTTLAGVSTAIAAGATASVNVGASFESAMSKVSAISGATGDDLTSLTDKAKEMGAKTKFSASESAEALQYMSMAGWDTKSMLDGIDGIMSLAAADGLDLATTSDIVTDALTAFGLKASDSTHFADVLAKASSSANTNVSMLGESFKYVAPLAGTMGYSVEDVSLALGLMANASIKGSQAGTSLKTALANLSAPTQQMAEVMDKYKISLTDSKGEALPLVDVLKHLREKFGDLSETEQTAAASTLFGKEAMSGMLAIINASDSDFKNLTENINNADGAAQSMADTMQNNLQGQITILKSSLEGLGIEIYDSMSEPLTEAVGGSGMGYHCKGQAADFCCYDSAGKQIDSKKIVCYLEDISCYGIGYKCGGSQYYTHADTRAASAKWWGDESKNYRSIQSINGSTSFYTYLGISKSTSSTTTTTTVKTTADKIMTLSANGLNLIKSFEGLSLKACKAVSTEKYYTIGYGHYGADVKANQTITEAEALALLKRDCTTFVSAVNEAVTVGVTQNQFDAMVSLAYNIGVNAFKSSDLVKFLNAGKPWAATAEFPLWRKSGGAILAGLQTRRQKEMSLFGVGCDYTLSDNMNVRSGAGTSYSIKKVSQLTADGKKHATSTNANDNAVFKKGTVVTAQELKAVYSTSKIDIWCRCPSGWICLKNGNDIYAV